MERRHYIWPTRKGEFEWKIQDAMCKQCGFIFAANIPDEGFLKEYYSNSFSIGSENLEISPPYSIQKRIETVRKYAKSGHRILEIGANRGEFCLALEKEGYIADGFDLLNSTKIDHGMPSKPEYDMVVSYFVLEHIAEPRVWLRKIHSILPEWGGKLLLEVPSFENYPNGSLNHDHLLQFTPYHLSALVDSERFRVIEYDNSASRFFGFLMVATTGRGGGWSFDKNVSRPNTLKTYRRGIKEKKSEQRVYKTIALDAVRLAEQNNLPINFWGANELATRISTELSILSKRPVKLFDNSKEKIGKPYPGFEEAVAGSDALTEASIFILCSPSWNIQIRKQIENSGVRAEFIDVRDYKIGTPQTNI